ncbi:unnamed protein product [Nippostrongylus brasiliensis]|uniref:DUF1830 domain-containing protein n=1 Tax=Nippostrongylus brasiliensis TaxID=27835 RepID=A0A0N4XMB2_NIPBR|nr:unnamed protein product [Nippostrongylus brasiliensis]
MSDVKGGIRTPANAVMVSVRWTEAGLVQHISLEPGNYCEVLFAARHNAQEAERTYSIVEEPIVFSINAQPHGHIVEGGCCELEIATRSISK